LYRLLRLRRLTRPGPPPHPPHARCHRATGALPWHSCRAGLAGGAGRFRRKDAA